MSGVIDSRSAAKMDLGKQPRDSPYELSEMKHDNGRVNNGQTAKKLQPGRQMMAVDRRACEDKQNHV